MHEIYLILPQTKHQLLERISCACVKQSVTMEMSARVAIKIRKSEMKRKHQFRVTKCLSTYFKPLLHWKGKGANVFINTKYFFDFEYPWKNVRWFDISSLYYIRPLPLAIPKNQSKSWGALGALPIIYIRGKIKFTGSRFIESDALYIQYFLWIWRTNDPHHKPHNVHDNSNNKLAVGWKALLVQPFTII